MDFENLDPKGIFYSEEIQKSWRIHALAFQPLLEDVFLNDYAARITLTAALNHISNRNFEIGLQKLDTLEDFCACDADRAALFFFRGVAYDMQGNREEMLAYYVRAGELYDRLYLPYLKVAKAAHTDADFLTAEQYYLSAIRCFDGAKPTVQNEIVLASAYTNYASCLMSVRRYAEAETALRCADKIRPARQGRDEMWEALRRLTAEEDEN